MLIVRYFATKPLPCCVFRAKMHQLTNKSKGVIFEIQILDRYLLGQKPIIWPD